MQIVVIGAGMSGLAAAYTLKKAGHQVTVVEARQRVGGRVWSIPLENGTIVEMGGEWLEESDLIVKRLANELAVPLAPIGVDFTLRQVVGGPPVSASEQLSMHEVAENALAQLDETTIEASTVDDFLKRLPVSQAQQAVLRARLQGSSGADLSQVALRELTGSFTIRGSNYFRIANGNQSLAEALAQAVDNVRLGIEVKRIEQSESQVTIQAVSQGEARSLIADYVVLSVPLKILGDIQFDPPLPENVQQAIDRIPMGIAAKVAVATEKSPPLRAVQDVSAPYWSWTGKGADGQPRSAVTAFAGSEQAMRSLDAVSDNPETWLSLLREAHPDLTLTGTPVFKYWGQDRLVRGCYSAFDNAAYEEADAFSQMAGRLVFAGEHTNGSGTINGALSSGVMAAEQLKHK